MKLFLSLISVFLFCTPLLADDSSREPLNNRTISFLPRETIDVSKMGVNAFVNDSRFGSINAQFTEVKDALGLTQVRVLFGWDDNVQPTPGSKPFFGFYDEIIKELPKGMRALVIITGLPSWMSDSSNWLGNDPRRTFHRRWIQKIIRRYRRKRKVVGFQIWNEPNMSTNSENDVLEFTSSPENYVSLLRRAKRYRDRRARKKLIVSAATTSIIQDYPETLEYNEALVSAGAEQYLDRWGIHFYGTSLERMLIPGGPSDFMNSLNKPIWITESGRQGINEQLNYVERVWPYITDDVPGIERIYFYQFTESSNAAETFGLKNLTEGQTVSDLYIWLRDRD